MSEWGHDCRVVVIDDSLTFLNLAERLLKKSGFKGEFHSYNSGKAFFESDYEDVDFILCDIDMPVMNGLAIHRRLKAEGFRGCFSFCSAHCDLLEKLQHVVIIPKPFDLSDILNVVKECLSLVKPR